MGLPVTVRENRLRVTRQRPLPTPHRTPGDSARARDPGARGSATPPALVLRTLAPLEMSSGPSVVPLVVEGAAQHLNSASLTSL